MTIPDLDEALALLDRVRTPAEVFGDDTAEAPRVYRRLARVLHPDANGGRTQEAFARLNALWRGYRRADPHTITTPRHSYPLLGRVACGDLADLYRSHYGAAGPRDGEVLVKMPRDPRDSDLMEREAVALRRLREDGDARFRPYVPNLVATFRHQDAATGARRRVNVVDRLMGFHSLAEVRAAHPGGVDPRDAAWMWRRLLVALGFAHRAGVLHGAVLPEHVLIHPERHGLVLVDWCYSVSGGHAATDTGGRVPAMVDRYADWYPPEVPARRTASPATDIHMATRCITHLMGDRAPKAMRLFARGCRLPAQERRPGDAWRLLAELDELLERLYGPRRFRPFTMPATR
ncbi:molecular chaperone DnaJ [Actinomadura miaoliensis]|uniref:Molecular chaperone DnaJ n=1 Tax=Actinomadura miaoliensis TaxID=430685 RepID=A0ABP7X335_9ACTN